VKTHISVTIDGQEMSVQVDPAPDLTDATYAAVLFQLLIAETSRLVRKHNCDDPNCNFVSFYTNFLIGINTLVNSIHEQAKTQSSPPTHTPGVRQ